MTKSASKLKARVPTGKDMAPKTMHRIAWSRAESDAVLAAAAHLLSDTGVALFSDLKWPNMSEAMISAQHMLPKERQRPEVSLKGPSPSIKAETIKTIKMHFEKIRKAEATQMAPSQSAAPNGNGAAAFVDHTEDAPDEPAHAPAPILPPAKMPSTRDPQVASNLLDALDGSFTTLVQHLAFRHAHIYAQALAGGIKTYLLAELGRQDLADAAMAQVRNQLGKFHRLPRVLIVGPLPAQQRILEQSLAGKLDLRFVASEDNPGLIKDRIGDCDTVFIWTNYVSHSHDSAVPINADKRLLKGGMDQIKTQLHAYAASQAAPGQ